MTDVYTPAYIAIAHEVARELRIKLAEGVYLGLRGPSYETPAEVRMLRKLGADALGMSTVPEAIVARHSGMQVLGISCITNVAAGMSGAPINHEEVIEVGARAGRQLAELIVGILPRLPAGSALGD
jgi:purine-nucleoside phosphorylase